MAEPGDEFRPEDEEVAGGAVKSFLEHLEDLRWMLIKSAAATLLAMMLCLFGAQKLMLILKWPMQRASQRHVAFLAESTNQTLTLQIGGTRLAPINLTTNRLGSLDLGTNQNVTLQLEPVSTNGQWLLSVRVVPGPAVADSSGPRLAFFDPAAPFLLVLHVAFFGGLMIASPFVLYFIGQFVMPALKIKEKKHFLRAFAVGAVLFLSGVSFAYFIIMPAALKFAELYAVWLGVEVPLWRAEDYASFLIKFMFGMGLGFELPVVLLALVKIGVLDYAKLSKMRRYMIVGNLILGALLTTPEVFTQIMMAVALQVLFEASVWIAWYWERQEKRRAASS